MKQIMGFEYLSFGTGDEDEEYLWVVNDQDGGLYRISKKDYKAEFIRTAIEEPKVGKTEYSYAVHNNGKIHFLPCRSTGKILIYDIKIDELTKIDLSMKDFLGFVVLKVGMYVWFFPYDVDKPLLRYRISEGKIEYLYTWKKLSVKYNLMVRSAVDALGKIWISTYNSSRVVELDIENFKVKLHELGKYKLGNISFDGKLFWFSLINESGIISWDKDRNIIKKYERNANVDYSSTGSIYNIVCISNKVILLPLYEKNIYLVDQQRGTIEPILKMPLYFKTYDNYSNHACFWGHLIVNKDLWIFPACGSHLLILTLNDMKVKGYELKNTKIELVYRQYLSGSNLLVENSDCNKCMLKGYLRVITAVDAEEIIKKETKYGADIIRYVKAEW